MGQPAFALQTDRVHWTVDDVRAVILANPVVIFCRGSQEHPRCGFSERVIAAFTELSLPFEVVDVSGQASIKAALREFTGEKSLPLAFVNGQLVGGFAEIESLVTEGKLSELVSSLMQNT